MTTAPLLSALVPTPTKRLTVEQTVAVIREEVTVIPSAQTAPLASHTANNSSQVWNWITLRDYVISQIISICGPTPRQPAYKEQAIFEGFIRRHGKNDPSLPTRIARYAFENAGGYWRNAPISVNRFCAASDPYFANPIVTHLDQVANA